MAGLTSFELVKVLQAIKDCTKDIHFSEILNTVKQSNVFKWAISPICQLSKTGIFDLFVIGCYRLVMLKSVFDTLKRDENHQCTQNPSVIKEIGNFTQELSRTIKQQYCRVLEKIPERKSQNIQFLIFLVCFSVKTSFSMICNKNLFLRRVFQSNCTNDVLQNQACSLINFEVTGIWVQPHLYRHLKKKYYLHDRPSFKNHRKAKSAEDLIEAFQFLAPVFQKITQQKYPKGKQTQKDKKISQFQNELKSIFQESSAKEQQKSSKKQKKQFKVNAEPALFNQMEQENNNLLGYVSMRNSSAFNEHRKNYTNFKNKKILGKENKTGNGKKGPGSQMKNKKNQKKNNSLNILSASLKLFFTKAERKPPINGNQKFNVENWKNKIRSIRCDGSLERVTLMNEAEKWRKVLPETQQQKQMMHKKGGSHLNNQISSQRLKSQRKSLNKKGFCEFIDAREPSQIGIVRSIVNFSNNLPEPKYHKICSKDLKHQYDEFNRKVFEHEESNLNENNYIYRLQKALTGTNKF